MFLHSTVKQHRPKTNDTKKFLLISHQEYQFLHYFRIYSSSAHLTLTFPPSSNFFGLKMQERKVLLFNQIMSRIMKWFLGKD